MDFKHISRYHLVRTQENEGQIHLQNERDGIIAKKFGRTPIHFVIDVFTTATLQVATILVAMASKILELATRFGE